MAGILDVRRIMHLDDPGTLEPVIKELIRTEVCSKPLRLLVDKILISRLPRSDIPRCEAYRLWLSDGEKIIQAILKSEMHPFVTSCDIREGSYVEITKYKLGRSNRKSGKGHIAFLLVADLYPYSDENRPRKPTFTYDYTSFRNEISSENASQVGQGERHSENRTNFSTFEQSMTSADSVSDDNAIDLVSCYENPLIVDKSTDDGDVEYMEHRSRKRKLHQSASPLQPIDTNSSPRANKSMMSSQTRSPAEPSCMDKPQDPERSQTKSAVSRPLLPILRPLRVTPLADLTGPKSSRNKVLDVCAVVYSVDPKIVKRKGMPDIRQLRLIDLSTKKKVLFSTFIDSTYFMPSPGTVALFRSVTTHEWDGGSLNAYHRDCGGRNWFIPEPVGVPGCDVNGLRALWRDISASKSISISTKETDAMSTSKRSDFSTERLI